MINTHGFVAQLVEQLTLNQLVESSSLSKPTKKDTYLSVFFSVHRPLINFLREVFLFGDIDYACFEYARLC